MDPAFAFRCPTESVVIAEPQVFISASILGGDNIASSYIANSKHLSTRQICISFISIKRNPAIRWKINLCPAVIDIIEAGIISTAAYGTHVADRNPQSSAQSDHRIRIF